MFDANAKYIPKGVKFFVGGSVSKNSILYSMGARQGQPYLCKMLDNSNKHPRVSIKINGKVKVVKVDYEKDAWSFLVYQGTPSGNGFICDKSKSACQNLIGKFNNTYWKRRKGLIK
jgi:uncharacterized Zn-finger protein